MLEARKQNIRSSILLVIMTCASSILCAQYSPTFVGDSTKTAILKSHKIGLQPTTMKDVSVNRNKMAIFCKWELDIEDYTKIPVKFRLGSQEVVDIMENKGPTTVKND